MLKLAQREGRGDSAHADAQQPFRTWRWMSCARCSLCSSLSSFACRIDSALSRTEAALALPARVCADLSGTTIEAMQAAWATRREASNEAIHVNRRGYGVWEEDLTAVPQRQQLSGRFGLEIPNKKKPFFLTPGAWRDYC